MENISEIRRSVYDKYNELSEELFEKIKGVPGPGLSVEIAWNNVDILESNDIGYLFQTEICDQSDDEDYFIHIPKPQNPYGMDDVNPVFTHLLFLIQNKEIESIIIHNEKN